MFSFSRPPQNRIARNPRLFRGLVNIPLVLLQRLERVFPRFIAVGNLLLHPAFLCASLQVSPRALALCVRVAVSPLRSFPQTGSISPPPRRYCGRAGLPATGCAAATIGSGASSQARAAFHSERERPRTKSPPPAGQFPAGHTRRESRARIPPGQIPGTRSCSCSYLRRRAFVHRVSAGHAIPTL